MHSTSILKTAITTSLILALAACNSGGNDASSTAPSETVLFDDSNAALVNSIVTGYNSSDGQTKWICDLNNDDEYRQNYVIQFWADKTGVTGNQSMSWYPISENKIAMSWDTNQLVIDNILFRENDDIVSMSATSDKNDRLDCQLSGPKPLPSDVLQDFVSGQDAKIINDQANQNDIWECITTDQSGSQTVRQYTFWADGVGTGDLGHFSWFFNEDENIILSYANEVRELRSVRYADDNPFSTNFTALDRQHTLNCRR